jgi:FHS family Na+ dependent glucose MFS transporter 1
LKIRLPISQSIGYFAGLLILGLFTSILGPTIPVLAENTRSALAQVSILFTARSLGYMLGSLYGGRLYDRMPGHRVLVIVLCLMAVGYFIIPLVSLLYILTVIMFLLGSTEGSLDVGTNTLLVWVHRERVASYMNALHFFFGIGASIGPIFVAQAMSKTGSITTAYWIIGACALPVAAWIARLSSPISPAVENENGGKQTNPILLALIVLFFFLYVGAEVGFGGWISTYATTLGLVSKADAAYLTSLYWGTFMVGRLAGIPIAARVHAHTILTFDLIGCILGLCILLLFPISLPLVAIGTMVFGLATASIFPTTIVWAERQIAITGKSARWFFVGAGAGGMFLPWLIGQYFVSIGPQVMVWIVLIDTILCAGVYAYLVVYSRSLKRQLNAV